MTPLAPFGPPYSDTELAEELVADSTPSPSPELQELADFLAGVLPQEHRDRVQRRIEQDPTYRAWAAPLLALDDYRPRTVWDVTRDDVRRLDRAISKRLALPASSPAPKQVNLPRRKRWWRLARVAVFSLVAVWATQGLVSVVGAALVPFALPTDPKALVNLTPRPGSQFTWAAALDPDGLPRVLVHGPGLVRVSLPSNMYQPSEFSRRRLRVETATDVIEVAFGVVRFTTTADGRLEPTLFFPGSATIRRRSDPPAAAKSMDVEVAELLRRMLAN